MYNGGILDIRQPRTIEEARRSLFRPAPLPCELLNQQRQRLWLISPGGPRGRAEHQKASKLQGFSLVFRFKCFQHKVNKNKPEKMPTHTSGFLHLGVIVSIRLALRRSCTNNYAVISRSCHRDQRRENTVVPVTGTQALGKVEPLAEMV